MNRTCATALALVNWKGVFYERYLLDRHVTALEGANGAGKTTVMIAAYVVLLPDLARLRFTNLGETAATGGDRGLWGRLGDSGRPSYAAMELGLADGSRIVAGVQLVKKTEPTLELTPFLVSGIDLQGSLKDLLLVSSEDHDDVPQLADVRAAAQRLGGTMQVFGSAKDYFGALFERGVMPLRLATDEERTKLHDMLRTSMTGGISRALTSELRSFLLREESGLADTLVRMRKNLDVCKRTRAEVAVARTLERDISGVYLAGAAMFAAAALGTREAAREARMQCEDAERRVQEAESHASALREEARKLDDACAEAQLRAESCARRVVDLEHSRARVESFRTASALLDAAKNEADRATRLAEETRHALDEATRLRDERRADRDRARDAYERASRGLGDLQAGLDELHLRAHAQRVAREQLAEARRLSGDADLDSAGLAKSLERTRAALTEIDGRRARVERELSLEKETHAEWTVAAAALEEIALAPIGDQPYEGARRELARLASLDALASRKDALAADLAHARTLAEAIARARERASKLGVVPGNPGDGDESGIARALALADAELHARTGEIRAAQNEASEASRCADAARAEATALELAVPKWVALAPALARLEASQGVKVQSIEDVTRLRGALAEELETARARAAARDAERAELLARAEQLTHGAGVPRALLTVRDLLSADLLAARFEGCTADEAPALEAALGPLAHALVVEDPGRAAEAIGQQKDAPHTVWLVAEDDVARVIQAAREQVDARETLDVLVREAHALRVTRKPVQPILGHDARARRASELTEEAAAAENAAARDLELAHRADALLRDAERLLADAVVFAGGDPAPKLEAARAREAEAERAFRAAETRGHAAETALAEARARRDAVQDLVRDAHLLTSPAPRVRELESEWEAAHAAALECARTNAARATLTASLEALRVSPSKTRAADALAERTRLDAERDRLFALTFALTSVLERKDALEVPDIDLALAGQNALRESLEAQHESARRGVAKSEEDVRAAEASWEAANIAWHAAHGEQAVRDAEHARLAAALEKLGNPPPADASVEALDEALLRARAEHAHFVTMERELTAARAATGERATHAAARLAAAQVELSRAKDVAAPLEAEWTAFAERASSAGVLETGLAEAASEEGAKATPSSHLAEARAQRGLVVTRLEHAPGGADGAAAVRAALEKHGESAAAYVDAWLAVRTWVMRRLPTQFALASDPGEALTRLRVDLASLAERVERHEADLRGTSEDVARGIDVQLRKTAARVRRLNRDLENVAFGSIGAVRVQVKRVERMELVLRALRGGEVQELLFQSDLPFEEALAEVFRRYGGGARAGTQRILDYREYVDLVVEVQRRGHADWEVASPTRLSTGEAIGVGAALMMVVLTEWERDANVLRSDRPTGTLRFLFLDEANRLSPDNLAVLFDMCHTLDLQLLIAAPEVARAHGNTTYRLVRHVDASGREEVRVSGRRASPLGVEGAQADVSASSAS